jgi:hypothetical protein
MALGLSLLSTCFINRLPRGSLNQTASKRYARNQRMYPDRVLREEIKKEEDMDVVSLPLTLRLVASSPDGGERSMSSAKRLPSRILLTV